MKALLLDDTHPLLEAGLAYAHGCVLALDATQRRRCVQTMVPSSAVRVPVSILTVYTLKCAFNVPVCSQHAYASAIRTQCVHIAVKFDQIAQHIILYKPASPAHCCLH